LPDAEEPESLLANALYAIRNENAIQCNQTQRVANSRGTEQLFQYIASTFNLAMAQPMRLGKRILAF
jgi:hypothetical protein